MLKSKNSEVKSQKPIFKHKVPFTGNVEFLYRDEHVIKTGKEVFTFLTFLILIFQSEKIFTI